MFLDRQFIKQNKDFVGEVKEINFETQKVKVIVSMFGRETPVDIEFINIKKINA